MNDNINNIPETEVTDTIIEQPKSYIDFVVEDDVYEIPEKTFSVAKVIAMIFGIVSGLFLLYYTVELFMSIKEQLDQYIQMGLVLPFSALILQYLPVILLFFVSLCPVVGGLLPKRYSKCSVLLFAIPVSYTFVDFIPQTIASFALNISMADAYLYILVSIAGILCLASAILRMFTGEEIYSFDNGDEIEFWEYDDENQDSEVTEATEEDTEIELAVEEIENEAASEEVDFAEPAKETENK